MLLKTTKNISFNIIFNFIRKTSCKNSNIIKTRIKINNVFIKNTIILISDKIFTISNLMNKKIKLILINKTIIIRNTIKNIRISIM